MRQYNRQDKQTGDGVRLVFLPSKSPWRHPIEPQWLHGKRKVVEPAHLLTTAELADRVSAVYDCVHELHLITPKKAA